MLDTARVIFLFRLEFHPDLKALGRGNSLGNGWNKSFHSVVPSTASILRVSLRDLTKQSHFSSENRQKGGFLIS